MDKIPYLFGKILYIPALIQHRDLLNCVYPIKYHQSLVAAFTHLDTDNHPFSCQVANFNAGWGSHVAEDVRLVGRRNLSRELQKFQLRPSAIAQN
jgi:hypothetical protein